jgi:hypothetical protein
MSTLSTKLGDHITMLAYIYSIYVFLPKYVLVSQKNLFFYSKYVLLNYIHQKIIKRLVRRKLAKMAKNCDHNIESKFDIGSDWIL